jgi:hypothetical protein
MKSNQGLLMLLKAARYREYIDSLNKKDQFEEMKRQLDYRIAYLDREFSLTELKFACPDKK